MCRRPKITGEVVDAETGKPITTFSVVPGIVFEGRPEASWQRDGTKDYKGLAEGKFDVKMGFPYPGYKVKVEADGYLPQESERFTLDGGDKHLVFKMKKGKGLTGVALTPDGEPAGQARAYLLTPGTNLQVQNGEVPEYGRRETLWVKIGDDGRFTFPPQAGEVKVLVLHPFGMAEVTGEQLSKSEQVKLEAWGEAKGVVMVGTKPMADAKAMANHSDSGSGRSNMNIFYGAEAKTGADGAFSFRWLRPGKWQFSRGVESGNSVMYASSVLVEFKPGPTVEVKIGGVGRAVTGKLAMPKELEARSDWTVDRIMLATEGKFLQRKTSPPSGLSREEQQKWFEEYQKSDEGKAFMEEVRKFSETRKNHWAMLDKATGRFRAEDVVAGKYTLAATAYKGVNQFRQGNEPAVANDRRQANQAGGLRWEGCAAGRLGPGRGGGRFDG